jgi:hypothetical protein
MNGMRRSFSCWRMSSSANRIPLRRDMRKFSAYFYKLTLPAGTFKQRGSVNPAVD